MTDDSTALPSAWFHQDGDGRMVEAPCRIDP